MKTEFIEKNHLRTAWKHGRAVEDNCRNCGAFRCAKFRQSSDRLRSGLEAWSRSVDGRRMLTGAQSIPFNVCGFQDQTIKWTTRWILAVLWQFAVERSVTCAFSKVSERLLRTMVTIYPFSLPSGSSSNLVNLFSLGGADKFKFEGGHFFFFFSWLFGLCMESSGQRGVACRFWNSNIERHASLPWDHWSRKVVGWGV